jgi:hypothetical protein
MSIEKQIIGQIIMKPDFLQSVDGLESLFSGRELEVFQIISQIWEEHHPSGTIPITLIAEKLRGDGAAAYASSLLDGLIPCDEEGFNLIAMELKKKKATSHLAAHLRDEIGLAERTGEQIDIDSLRGEFADLDELESTTPELKINSPFLNSWVKSIIPVTDAPKTFILFSGIGLLSGFLNKFYFRYPRRTPLNLYILLLAPSTLCRKSVCIDLASDYLAEVNPDLILPESFSPEALIEILGKQNHGILLWRELIQVKEFNFGSDYSKALPSLLTDIYDYKARLKRWTKAEKEIVAENPTLTILSAGIQDWLVSGLRQEDFMGGIWTRFLFIPGPDHQHKAFRLPRPFDFSASILDKLGKLNAVKGSEIALDPILVSLVKWGQRHQAQAAGIENSLMQANFLRLEIALIKIAALIQLADNPVSRAIELPAFEDACRIISFLKNAIPIFFREHVHFGEFDKAKAQVIRILRKHGMASQSDLIRISHLKTKFLKEITDQLSAEGIVESVPVPSTGGRPGTAWKLK